MKDIIVKYLTNKLTDLELKQLLDWLKKPKNLKEFQALVKQNYNINIVYDYINEETALEKVKSAIQNKEKPLKKLYWSYAVAASIALLISLTFIFNKNNIQVSEPIIVNSNIKVGTDKATLTLEDGSVIALEKGNTYQTQYVNSNGEDIIYEVGERKSTEVTYNYLTVPRGGQYHVVLSDGTEVWLNSESKLKYPVKFGKDKTRNVELVYGEAYFKVSPSNKHNGMSFSLLTKSQRVNVLGTEFNVKAYNDDNDIATTLVEGEIRVEKGKNSRVLRPNQQSKIGHDTDLINVLEIEDMSQEVSWVNGRFTFNEESLDEIMKVLSRWYNVQVVFETDKQKKLVFTGILKRTKSIENILNLIAVTSKEQMKFEINNKTITFK